MKRYLCTIIGVIAFLIFLAMAVWANDEDEGEEVAS